MDEAQARIAQLELAPHPEGGWYRRVHESPEAVDGRPVETAIVYLLRAGERSHWHRIDATETWSHVEGAPMVVRVADGGGAAVDHRVAGDAEAVVAPFAWQSAHPDGAWSLVRCAVRPGFSFDGFELAPPSWSPPGG